VVGVNAERSVAVVADMHSIGNRPSVKLPRDAMCLEGLTALAARIDDSVSGLRSSSGPKPAIEPLLGCVAPEPVF
jgi:hypothetical protein